MTVFFVECRDEHLADVQRFLARVYRPDYVLRINEALFGWQFGRSPESGQYTLKLALIDGKIIGCLGYIPIEVSLGEHPARGAWVANWMVDPKKRRLGLGPLLMREVVRQHEVTLNVGPNRDARDILTRMGWTDFGDLNRYVCVLDVEATATLTETGRLEWPVEASLQEESLQATTVRLVKRFSDDATQLWDRVWGKSAAGTRRSAEFLNWRYAHHPVFDYRLFEAHYRGRLSGFAIYHVEQVRDMPVRVGRIVDLVCEAEVEESLLRVVLDDARSQGVALLDFFCSSQRFSTLMAQHCFLPGEDEAVAQIPILFQPIDHRRTGIPFMAYLGNFPDATRSLDWYVTKGDGDQDRPN